MKAQPYRFTICALSTVMVFVCVGLVSNAFSICLPFIIKVHGFSNTQISLLATMKSVTSLLAMFAADRYYGRLGLKKESHWQCCLPRSHFLSTAYHPHHSFTAPHRLCPA